MLKKTSTDKVSLGMKCDLSQGYLKSIMSYNKGTGDFRWKKRPDKGPIWMARYPGSLAGTVTSGGYRLIVVDGKQYKAHRLAFLYVTGEMPKDVVDHKNGNPTDNRWKNLREADTSKNRMNAKISKNSTSGFKGVYLLKRGWACSVTCEGKRKVLKYFQSPEAANAACIKLRLKLHGSFSRLK